MKKIEIENHRVSMLGFNGDDVLLLPGKNLVDLDKWQRVEETSKDFVDHYVNLTKEGPRNPKDKNLLGITIGEIVEVKPEKAAVPGTTGQAKIAIRNTDSLEEVNLWLEGEKRPKVIEELRKRKADLAKNAPKAEPAKAEPAKADDKPKAKQPVKGD